MAELQTPSSRIRRMSEFWPVVAVFVISMLATGVGWLTATREAHDDGQIRFERATQLVREDLTNTLQAYGLFLRASVGLFQASEGVTRADWRKYVTDLDLAGNYPGIQGVSYNAILRSRPEAEAFAEQVRRTDWPGFALKPEGERELYTPVLYLEPLDARNERALGFDIYSEPVRRSAVDTAIATGAPALTEKIQLVQEDEADGESQVQAGVLLMLPVYSGTGALGSATARQADATGLVVSVFRMGDLVQSIVDKAGIDAAGRVAVGLYDAAAPSADAALFVDEGLSEGGLSQARFGATETLDIFGRTWTMSAVSTPRFEAEVATAMPMLVLVGGTLVSLLLTSLTLGQALRARETALGAERLAASQNHIQMLMGEVNHRSKNLLGLVQAIARQTRSSDSEAFMQNFSARLSALSASQDLLVRNEWKGIEIGQLVTSQLAHFSDLIGKRIHAEGPELNLTAKAAQSIGMAIHELGTNARKYGALSNDTGTIEIRWSLGGTDEERTFSITWAERGGPPVEPPVNRGFGSKVTGVMARYALEGSVDSAFEPEGLIWTLVCPAERALDQAALTPAST